MTTPNASGSSRRMTCGEVEAVLAELIGGELDGPAREDARRHVAECRACAARIDGLRRAAGAVALAAGSSETAQRATEGVSLPRGAGVEAGPVSRVVRRRSLWPVAVAAGLAMMFAAGYVAGRSAARVESRKTGTSPHVTVHTQGAGSARIVAVADMPSVVRRYGDAARAFPKSTSLGWSLVSIAKK